MGIKYWEFEDAPVKEKIKSPKIRDIARVFFDNETGAYRFALLLTEVKKKGTLKLKDVPAQVPISTAVRYLNFGVEIGMLKHENESYQLTDRFTRPFRNLATYMKAWCDAPSEDDIEVQFANAKFEKQVKRGGRIKDAAVADQPFEAQSSDAASITL